MDAANKIQNLLDALKEEANELVDDLEEKARKWEGKCHVVTLANQQLMEEFGKARQEIGRLHGGSRQVGVENARLKRLLVGRDREMERLLVRAEEEGLLDLLLEKDPMEVFPGEVWRMIFGHLRDPRDLKSCYYASIKFQPLLQQQRNTFLFLDVVKMLGNHVPDFLLPNPTNPFSDLLNCRLVCYGWKVSVDHFLQEGDPSSQHVHVRKYESTAVYFAISRNLWNDPMIQRVSPDVNPMPGRYLIYSDRYPWNTAQREKRRFENAFASFVRKFGHHVWYFSVQYDHSNEDKVWSSWYFSLLQWLNVMPNLKELHLQQPFHEWWDEYRTIYNIDEDALISFRQHPEYKDMINWLGEQISRNAFPTIPSLKTVILDDCPASVIEAVLKANPHIELIRVDQSCGNTMEFDWNPFKLDKLKELRFIHRSYSCDKFKHVNWTSLRKLTLDASSDKVCWAKLFQVLGNRLGETLIELKLKLGGSWSGDGDNNNVRLELPQLKWFKLEVSNYCESIDFMLPLVRLEKLSVKFSQRYLDKGQDERMASGIGEIIKFHEFTHDLENSNIWTLFPNLKRVKTRAGFCCFGGVDAVGFSDTLSCRRQTCTREQWMWRCS